MMHYTAEGIGYMGFGFLFQFLIFVAFFLVVLWLIKNNRFEKDNKEKLQDPMTILKIRLAKGEITKKEFEELKKEIL